MPENRPFSEGATVIVAALDSIDKSGAKYICSGVADDVDIQAAIDELPASGGKVLLLDGSFETIANLDVPDYVTLEGVGKATIIKPDGGAITQGIDVTGDHVTIKNLKVEMQAGVGTGGARPNTIRSANNDYCTFENVWVYGDITSGDDMSDDRQCGIQLVIGLYNSVINVHSENNYSHGLYIKGVSTYNRVIGGCYEGNVNHGIRFDGGSINNIIDGVVVRNNTQNGIMISASDENVIVECQVQDNDTFGIYIHKSSYCTIQGNDVTDTTQDGIRVFGDGTGNADYNVIVGNNCYNNGGNGIEVFGGQYANFNTVEDNQLNGNIGVNFIDAGFNTDAYKRQVAYYDNMVATAGGNYIVNNEALNVGTPITFTLAAQPDAPRSITWLFDSHVQITEFTITIIGFNARGKAITQTITETDGWAGRFDDVYSLITSIIMTARTGTGAGDTMDIGVGSNLGLPDEIFAVEDVYKCTRNGTDYSGAGNITPDVTYGFVDVSPGIGVIVANDDIVIYYKKHKNQLK